MFYAFTAVGLTCAYLSKLTSYPAGGGMDISLGPCVLPFVTHQDVPHHPDQLEDHEAGEEGQQMFLFNNAGAGNIGQHHGEPDQQQIGPILTAEEFCVLLWIVP